MDRYPLVVWHNGRTVELELSVETHDRLRKIVFKKGISRFDVVRKAFEDKGEVSEEAILAYLNEHKEELE